jgi:hypothetical protein
VTAALVVPLLVLLAPAEKETRTQAQALLNQGTELYAHGDYAAALEKFKSAYEVFPSPKLWFNIGQANRDLGRPVDALEAFQHFLADAPDAPAETIAEARRSAAELRSKLGRLEITSATSDAEVTVDGKLVGATPLVDPVWTTPGSHQVAVRHPGYAAAIEDVYVKPGALRSVAITLRPLDLQARGPGGALVGAERKAPIYRRPWFWVTVGAVVAAAGVTVYLISQRSGSSGPTFLGTQTAFQ